MHLMYTFRSVLIFSVLFWTYISFLNVYLFSLFLINVDVSLLRQSYSKNTVFFNKRCRFSAMCNVNVCKTWSNRSSRVQIPRDICTRFGCYLYSSEWSWIIRLNIHLNYFPFSDWLTSPGQFFITSWCWPNLEDASNIPSIDDIMRKQPRFKANIPSINLEFPGTEA